MPGVCFREDMCVETAQGVECGPCPDGYTGDGFNCDDVDEVRMAGGKHMSPADTAGSGRAYGNTATYTWIQMFFNGRAGRRGVSVRQLESIRLSAA